MHTNLVTESYGKIASQLDAAAGWLKSIGIQLESGRLAVYKNHFHQLLSAHRSGTIEQLTEALGFEAIHNSILEAAEWLAIFRTLSSIQSGDIRERLRHFVKGPEYARDERPESSSNRPRDTAFELNISAHFACASFPVRFGSNADLETDLQDMPLFVECKRPQTEHQLNSRIKGALKQLHCRYENSQNPEMSRGLVAISMTKMWNPTAKILRVLDEVALDVELSRITGAFIQRHCHRWRSPSDSQTLGALVQFRCLAYLTGSPRIVSCTQFALSNRLGLTSSDIRMLRVLTERFLDARTAPP